MGKVLSSLVFPLNCIYAAFSSLNSLFGRLFPIATAAVLPLLLPLLLFGIRMRVCVVCAHTYGMSGTDVCSLYIRTATSNVVDSAFFSPNVLHCR